MFLKNLFLRIVLLFYILFPNGSLFAQDLLNYRNSQVINAENDILTPKNIKYLLRSDTSIEVQTLFKRYRTIYTIKKIILVTERIFILTSVGYRTGEPKLNVTNLCIGLTSASLDLLVNKHFLKSAEKFVEEYNYYVSEKNQKN